MEQDIREHILKYVKENGVKYSFIATKVGIDRSTICHFIKNDRPVAKKVCINLADFLKEVGYL